MDKIGHKQDFKILRHHKHRRNRIVLLACFAVMIIIFAYIYFFILFPSVEKRVLVKPELGDEIDSENVAWIANEIGLYKLHASPLSNQTPKLNIYLTDSSTVFGVEVIENHPFFSSEPVVGPDVELFTDDQTFIEMYSAEDFNQKIAEEYAEGTVQINLIKDPTTLSLMGYGAIYENFR